MPLRRLPLLLLPLLALACTPKTPIDHLNGEWKFSIGETTQACQAVGDKQKEKDIGSFRDVRLNIDAKQSAAALSAPDNANKYQTFAKFLLIPQGKETAVTLNGDYVGDFVVRPNGSLMLIDNDAPEDKLVFTR